MFELEIQCPRCRKIRKMRTGIMRREDLKWISAKCFVCGKSFKLKSTEGHFNRIIKIRKIK